ncbi:Hypothetical predicted protein [Paramuricea clavata]|uniref:Uncharacterized protein n=1 Tax=Paramuricea clavata TaxID=317549 RepID=A0A6S7J496_PARCT|nr:Hypothetical predicted protein [Paramuricea clavata]
MALAGAKTKDGISGRNLQLLQRRVINSKDIFNCNTTFRMPSNLWLRSSSSMENDVQSAIRKLEMISRDFPTVPNIATQFAKKAKSELAFFDTDVAVEESLPSKATKRIPKLER